MTAEKSIQFGNLFTKFRLRAEFLTLSEFGKALADEGLLYEDSIFSRWQQGTRVPKDRQLLLTIIKVFIKRNGITSIDEANYFLESANHGYLTPTEVQGVFSNHAVQEPKGNSYETFISQQYMQESHVLFTTITNVPNKPEYIENQLTILYEKIFEGFSYMVYNTLTEFEKVLVPLQLNTTTEGKRLASKIHWLKLRCLLDISQPKEFIEAVKEADIAYAFAKENHTAELGAIIWMRTAIRRLALLTGHKDTFSQRVVADYGDDLRYALSITPHIDTSTRLVEHLEIAKIALILKDQKMFSENLTEAHKLVGRLVPDMKYLSAAVWDIEARGSVRFEEDAETALSHIQLGKSYIQKRHQGMGLYLANTEIQVLQMSRDQAFLKRAEQVKEETVLKVTLLKNPYQELRLKKKEFIGL